MYLSGELPKLCLDSPQTFGNVLKCVKKQLYSFRYNRTKRKSTLLAGGTREITGDNISLRYLRPAHQPHYLTKETTPLRRKICSRKAKRNNTSENSRDATYGQPSHPRWLLNSRVDLKLPVWALSVKEPNCPDNWAIDDVKLSLSLDQAAFAQSYFHKPILKKEAFTGFFPAQEITESWRLVPIVLPHKAENWWDHTRLRVGTWEALWYHSQTLSLVSHMAPQATIQSQHESGSLSRMVNFLSSPKNRTNGSSAKVASPLRAYSGCPSFNASTSESICITLSSIFLIRK